MLQIEELSSDRNKVLVADSKPWYRFDISLVTKFLLPIFIALAIFVFNSPYLFTDMLWHDDGLWYFCASEGPEWFSKLFSYNPRGSISALVPYLDTFYSYGMVSLGLPITRGLFVLVMALSSIILFYLYRDVFGINSILSLIAAIIPNILPSLKGIPVGLNASYAMWGLLPIVASLLILSNALKAEGRFSWFMLGIAFCLYAIGLNMTPSANFLIPCVLFFFLFYFPNRKFRTLIGVTPFLVYGIWQLYKQTRYTHRNPTIIPFHIVIDRIRQFFEMSSFLPFNKPYSLYIAAGLFIVGLFGLLLMSSYLYIQPNHLNYNKNYCRVLLIGWPICWIISNSVAYIAFSSEFRVEDYAYISNFGLVFIQSAGIILLFNFFFETVKIRDAKKFIFIIALSVIGFVGYQRIHYKNLDWSWKAGQEHTSKVLRSGLANYNFLPKSQVLILGSHIATFYNDGVLYPNSGYLRYLTGQKDIYSLIGPDKYPTDVFAPWNGWFKRMRGFSSNKPVSAFQFKDNSLERVNLMLQVVSSGKKELPRLEWTLYDISSGDIPSKLSEGKGLASYLRYVEQDIPEQFKNSYIAFAPQGIPDTILSEDDAAQFSEQAGLIKESYKIGKHITLRNITIINNNGQNHLQILLRVDSIPISVVRLAYTLNEKKTTVSLWDFVMEGDNLLITTAPIDGTTIDRGVSLGLMDVGRWPNVPLVIENGEFAGRDHLVLRKGSSS